MIERDWLHIEQAKRITSRDRTARISEAHKRSTQQLVEIIRLVFRSLTFVGVVRSTLSLQH